MSTPSTVRTLSASVLALPVSVTLHLTRRSDLLLGASAGQSSLGSRHATGSSPVVSLPLCSGDWPPAYSAAGLCLSLLLLPDPGWCREGIRLGPAVKINPRLSVYIFVIGSRPPRGTEYV